MYNRYKGKIYDYFELRFIDKSFKNEDRLNYWRKQTANHLN